MLDHCTASFFSNGDEMLKIAETAKNTLTRIGDHCYATTTPAIKRDAKKLWRERDLAENQIRSRTVGTTSFGRPRSSRRPDPHSCSVYTVHIHDYISYLVLGEFSLLPRFFLRRASGTDRAFQPRSPEKWCNSLTPRRFDVYRQSHLFSLNKTRRCKTLHTCF